VLQKIVFVSLNLLQSEIFAFAGYCTVLKHQWKEEICLATRRKELLKFMDKKKPLNFLTCKFTPRPKGKIGKKRFY